LFLFNANYLYCYTGVIINLKPLIYGILFRCGAQVGVFGIGASGARGSSTAAAFIDGEIDHVGGGIVASD
ncbi:hypothetical protein DOY81_014359, partial [Sarcophaga bullata]